MKAMKASGAMTATAAYGAVAESTGLKAKDVKAAVGGIETVAAAELKKNGSFKVKGVNPFLIRAINSTEKIVKTF